jgi:hypothetical protein
MNKRVEWLAPRLLVVFGLGCAAAADVPGSANTEKIPPKPPVDAKLIVENGHQAEQRPRASYLQIWYENRGYWDVVHVRNVGTSAALWSGRIYEGSKGCTCALPNACYVGPACTSPNFGDTRAYAGAHSCLPVLVISESQDYPQCPAK